MQNKRYEVPADYTWQTKIATYEAGQDKRLRPSGLLKLQQEVGELHLGGGGLTWEEFLRHGMVFVLTRMNTVIHRAPRLDETVWVKTWHRDTKGVQFFRCYQFLNGEGQALIESVSAFALVDPIEHKLLRPNVFEQFGIATQPGRVNGCPDPGKLPLPAEMAPAGKRPVYWSDTDYNGHLNNTVYADILCDFLPGGMTGRRVTGFSIAFVKEAMEGEVLDIAVSAGEGKGYVTASHSRGRCFDARLTFEPEDT